MSHSRQHQPVTIERVERALLVVTYMMEKDRDGLVPIHEKLERELETLKRNEVTMKRAPQRLEANSHRLVEIGQKANER
jgi:hypothetical protein